MDERYSYQPANCFIKPPSPQCIVVQQVIGEQDVQKTIDIHLVVPKHKPAIEQVVDVLVKKLCITNVEVLSHKVIVRGSFELKALYVACLPSQPVHAIEARHVRFTAAAHFHGCHYGSDADAHAVVEYVDYSACRRSFRKFRAYGSAPKWKKYHTPKNDKYDHYDEDDCEKHYHDDCKPHHHDDYEPDCHDHCKPHHHDDCESDCHDHCKPHHHDDCKPHHHDDCKPHHHDDCKPQCKPKHKPCKPSHCFRAIDATVIIRIRIKVTTDREVVLYAGGGQLPYKPKG